MLLGLFSYFSFFDNVILNFQISIQNIRNQIQAPKDVNIRKIFIKIATIQI